MSTTTEFRFIRTETHDDGRVARIVLNRPEFRNAQNRGLLVELDDALAAAEADDVVRVIVLAGEGPSFSAGHDMGTPDYVRERSAGPEQHESYRQHGGTCTAVEGRYHQEDHYFFRNTRRWRDLRKVTIAETKGNVLSAGLMLAWCCDLIVAAEGTVFADVVGTRLGMCGVEYFAHPWEFGPRRAKELLMTGDFLDADEAYRLGMVNKVFASEELTPMTLKFAARIAQLPAMTTLMIKKSVNQAMDSMGFSASLDGGFALHQLNHAHWTVVSQGRTPIGTPEFGLPDWRAEGPIRPARRDEV